MSDLDDAKKRQKGIAVGKGRPVPLPDGTIDAGDRASIAKVYSNATGGGSPGLRGGFKIYGDGSGYIFKRT